MDTPDLSVIVPARDEAENLRGLLRSLAAQTLPREKFEVIVVDNASRDATSRIAEEEGARVISEPAPGRARARNTGVAASRGLRLAFIDADCVATPDWLRSLNASAGTAPLVAGLIRVTTSGQPNAVERFERLWRFDQAGSVPQGWAATANLLVDRKAFDAIGGFDVAYLSIGEDADFCLRASEAGFELAYSAEAIVEHRGEDRMWPMLKRLFWHGYSSAQVYRRVGRGAVAWRHPRPLFNAALAARAIGADRPEVPASDRKTMRRLARAGYAARIAGSIWSDARRAR